MKVTLLKLTRKKEVVKRLEPQALADMIRNNPEERKVFNLRLHYQFMKPIRMDDGQVTIDSDKHLVNLSRICFAAEFDFYREKTRVHHYNGLVVIEVNGLKTYEEAVGIRNKAAKMDETLMAFLGASGMSVKIVCRGELFGTSTDSSEGREKLPTKEEDIRQFHKNLYDTARRAYQNQFGLDIEYLEPKLERTVYLSADPEMYFNPEARPFKADCERHDQPEPTPISWESSMLMPGRTIARTYHFNWLFIIRQVIGECIDLPDEDRQMQMLQQIARLSLEQGIPLAHAQGMTLEHPLFHNDPDLVRTVFATAYEMTLIEDYRKTHKMKPLKSVPEETLQTMRTEIFLTANYDMRKNLMTGVAEYRKKYAEDQTYRPLTTEVRNDMTIQAREQGLKSWDQDVNRFIDSTRIEQYDPVNTWLNSLQPWDGHDYIAERDYYNDKLNFKNEFDLNIALTSFALINIDEFDKTTKSQQIVLKYLLSSADVKFRPPYGKTIKQYRRYTSFIGTTNKLQPLTDPTGSRRFVCVGVNGNINFEDNLNHRQLFAQALHLFNNKERFWLNDEEIEQLLEENEPFEMAVPLLDLVAETFRKPKEGEGKWWRAEEILTHLDNLYPFFKKKNESHGSLGIVMSNPRFNFKRRYMSHGAEYWLTEK